LHCIENGSRWHGAVLVDDGFALGFSVGREVLSGATAVDSPLGDVTG
jgi:hypothetical protein